MQPRLWHPQTELSNAEQAIVNRIKRAKLFIFLRQVRHQLFDDEFQTELAKIYDDSPRGQPPIPPAPLALAIILQAYTGASDDEAIESLLMDKRWQLVLDCLECEEPPFSQATLVRFRTQLIKRRLDRRLIERTVELAKQTGGFGSKNLRAALDSSPLWGAAKVEDTYNLLGHALKKAMSVIARQQGGELTAIATELGAEFLSGSSVKAALDIDWDNPEERTEALSKLLVALQAVENWLEQNHQVPVADSIEQNLKVAQQVQSQDVEVTANGTPQLRQGVAKNRRISVEDPTMRHGRKSRSQRFDGYKRHVLTDLEIGVVRAVGLTPANVPEAWISDAISNDLKAQDVTLVELQIDRAYLSSKLVRQRTEELKIYCKAWPVRNRDGRLDKTAFVLDWEEQKITCPNQITLPFEVGAKVQFPKSDCGNCPLQAGCTTNPRGRSISIHAEEQLLQEFRQRQLTRIGASKTA